MPRARRSDSIFPGLSAFSAPFEADRQNRRRQERYRNLRSDDRYAEYTEFTELNDRMDPHPLL